MTTQRSNGSSNISRRDVIRGGAGLGAAAVFSGQLSAAHATTGANGGGTGLELFDSGFPKAFFFRREDLFEELTYEEWAAQYSRLGGMVVRISDSSPNAVEYTTRFKRENPEQLVVMHYNGRLRSPIFDPFDLFGFAGHFYYRAGTNLSAGVSASDTELNVADPAIFQLDIGTVGDEVVHDEIAIVTRNADGSLNWEAAEQVKLADIDEVAGTITVERGQYDTSALDFAAGAYVAPHIVAGPFGAGLTWALNLSQDAPKDSNGVSAIDLFVEDIARHFEPGGDLDALDGVQLDVYSFEMGGGNTTGAELADVDNDGVVDRGYVDGVNVYGLGLLEATRRLRERLPNKLINVDGGAARVPKRVGGPSEYGQRPDHTIVNGIEKEGFPAPADPRHENWSTVFEALRFFDMHSRQPKLNFINHYRANWAGAPAPLDPPSDRRLVWAAAQLAGVGLTLRNDGEPDREDENVVPVLDEDWKGVEKEKYWLGRPLGQAKYLAERTPDLLRGQGVAWTTRFINRFEGTGVSFERSRRYWRPALAVGISEDAGDGDFHEEVAQFGTGAKGAGFRLAGIDVPGEDLVVTIELTSPEPVEGFPEEIGRLLKVAATVEGSDELGKILFTYSNEDSFTARLYFREIGPARVDLSFLAEGDGPLYIRKLRAYSARNVMYREFENGIVLANAAWKEQFINLAELFPGQKLRRIQATPAQDTETNNGEPVDGEVRLGATDALALVRD